MAEARDQLQSLGVVSDSLQILAVPFHQSVTEFIDEHETIFVVDQNRDGQMRTVLMSELDCDPVKLQSILHFDGSPLNAGTVVEQIKKSLGKSADAKASSGRMAKSATGAAE